MSSTPRNIDADVVLGFGDEWSRFDQTALSAEERQVLWSNYFSIFPWDSLPPHAHGIDLGCGSGRWAKLVAPLVGTLECVDASDDALEVARRALASLPNVRFTHASVDALPFPTGHFDFGYSLGVLHHIPDTEAGLCALTSTLKPGAPFLLYLYYAFDNRPAWFRQLWKLSEILRHTISRSPMKVRYALSQLCAAFLYWPLARSARLAEIVGMNVGNFPLATYRRLSFYTMRTDALDRLGTRLEQRFTREQVRSMMERCSLRDVRFSEGPVFWVAVGIKQ